MNRIVIHTILLLILLIKPTETAASITVSLGQNTINQQVQYTFQLTLGTTGITPGTATLTFNSSGYTFANSSAISNCYNTLTPTTLYSCYASSSTSISFRWLSTMSSPLYLSINPLTNPPYVDNYTVSFDFYADSSVTFQTVYGTINTLQPDTLTSCSMSFSPNYTNTLSNISFTMVNKNSIPSGGSLQLTFNAYTPSYSTLAIYTTSGYINSASTITPSGSVFFMSGFFSSTVPAGTTLAFSIAFINTPPTIGSSLYSITILTSAKSNFLNKIDQKTCSISNIENYPIASLTAEPSSTMLVGNTKVLMYVNFKAPADVDFTTDTMVVTVASGFTTYLSIYYLSITVTTNVTVGGLPGANTTNGVTFPTSSTALSISSGTAVQITGGLFSTSAVNSGTKTIAVQFFRNGYSYSYNTATVTIYPNVLQNATLSVLSPTVAATTTYTFVMQINNPLGVGAGVKITLPSSISIATGTCTVTSSLSVVNAESSTVLCSASTTQSIFVSNISSATLPSGTTITLAVQNINNPTTTKTSSSLTYQTYYSLSETTNPVDDSTGFSLTVTPSPVTIPNANFAVSRTSNTNLQYASYTFTYKVYTTFPANGYIKILLPAAMTLQSGATVHYVISTTGTNNTISVSSSTSASYTTLTLDFNGLVTSTLPSNTIFTITVTNILNYYSYKPVNVQLISYTNDDYSIQQSNLAAVTLTNSSPDTTLAVGVSNSNTINGKSITYTFSITSPAALSATDQISIQLITTNNVNTQLVYSSSVSCTFKGVTATCSKDISNSKLLLLTTGTTATAGSSATITITSITLTRSLEQPGTINFKTFQQSSGAYYLISTYTLTPPSNSQTNLITAASISIIDNGINSARLNVATSFTLSLSPTNTLISGDFIVTSVPSEWTNIQSSMVTVTNASNIGSMTGSLCTGVTVFCSNYLGDPSKIRIDDKTGTAFPGVTNISFTLSSSVFVSPKDWATSYSTFSFATYTNNSYGIDTTQTGNTTNTAAFSLACPSTTQYHCKTCNGTGFCTACYQLGEGYVTTWDYGAYYFRQSTGQCVTACGGNYYNNSNFCEQCTAPCYGCLNSSTSSCTSCIAPSVLNSSTCLSNCPDGYFNSSGVCSVCTSPCVTCSGSASTCLSCENNTYLNGNTCGSNCNGVTGKYADSSTWTCASCIVNCSSCSVTASNCTGCASTYFLTSNNVCTQNCPTGTAKLNSTTCTCNYTACLTCALTINTCISCDPGLVLKDSTCTTSCGSNYYLSNSTCVACVSNCQTCSSSGCTVCNSTASLLYNNACYSSCPTGTSQSGSSCITCSTGCNSCTSATVCTACLSIYYMVIYANLTAQCVRPCPTTFPYLQSGICVTTCTSPLTPDSSNTCVNANATTNPTSTVTTLTSQSSKVIPFPVTIGLAVLGIACIASKVALPETILAACLCSFAGLMEVIGWFVFIIVAAVSTDSSATVTKIGMIVVLIAYLLTLVLNVLTIVFFKNYIWPDQKFQVQLKKLRAKTKCGVSITYLVCILTVALSHKIIQILFSNLFETQYFLYKVTQVNKFTPFNYVRYASIICTATAIVGAGMANYEVQSLSLSSLTFIQSIDMILVTILAAILGIWATVRNSEQYEKTLAEKRNEGEEELSHDPIEDDLNQFETDIKSGMQKKYTFISSQRHSDPKEDPLKQKLRGDKNPIGEEVNITSMPLDNHDDENRVNLSLQQSDAIGKKRISADSIDIDQFVLNEQSGDSLLPKKTRGVSMSYQQMSQKQKLKDAIEKKLSKEERQKARVIRDVDEIQTTVLAGGMEAQTAKQDSQGNIKDLTKNQAKKQKLSVLSNTSSEELEKLPEEQRGKAEEIKDAMSILTAKKISIEDYLDYLDIIEEENEDKNSNEYENIKLSPMGQKGKNKKPISNSNYGKNKKGSKVKDRSARYKVDDKLHLNYMDDSELGPGTFDEEDEPRPPNFHSQTRPRNQSEDIPANQIDEFGLSGLRSKGSEQMFSKNKQILSDMVMISLQSGDNDDPSLGQQFQRGNTLKQVEKDELPPSNLYATQRTAEPKMNVNTFPVGHSAFAKDKIGKNRLIGDDDNIEYIESEGVDNQTVKNQLLDFNNDISPSQFDQPNLRIQNDEVSNAPTKPKIAKKNPTHRYDNNDQVLEIQDLEEVDGDQQFQADPNSKKTGMNRYQSDRNLDYDDILYQRRKNEKVKQLQQIYLPRQQVPRAYRPKKRLNQSTNTHRQQK